MLTGYTGKVIDGKPALTEAAKLPEGADIIIMVLPPTEAKTEIKADEKKEIAERLKMLESITGILAGHDIDLDKIREERITKRGLLE